ncbi:hypothetical protein WOLCODRAFT_157381 [Wolfiporia cocos MD-104 SS10]|uniref:Actin-like ATPase domain-containing protein n=1 Tax=Wolfiporia cocos (strain MD-104) TaxID=742152 RepID=A0A2H3JA53_WOLCO|nr:hypothetical protein WOLCODRAFT_157381 [Wolfiporia cocos MD-104 SS10]
MQTLQPYRGYTRKLILAFDVGTTYSGVAYALLDPGATPQIVGVTRFPGQESAVGDSKIPSILYYSSDGAVRACGAEAKLPQVVDKAEDEGWTLVEWFKLHLRPTSLKSEEAIRARIPPLPWGKTVIDVFADFLQYLFSCTQKYIVGTHANGESLWASVESRIEFVLSHPNGWEGNQQTKMRRAAAQGGLVPDTQAGHSRIHFVTEGEASMHFCINSGFATETLQCGSGIMVVDAGGGTVDISTYKFSALSPLAIEEVVAPDCIMQGSTTINVRARVFLENKLQNSSYKDDIGAMMDYFDKSTKPIFKSCNDTSYIKFGTMKCNDPAVGIRRGQMLLTGSEVVEFFEPSITLIVDTVLEQRFDSPVSVTTVFLVGGFAASPWLFSQLQLALQRAGLTLSRPDGHTSKAVATGAISHYLDHWVSVRVARVTYGVPYATTYIATNPEHFARRDKQITDPSGHPVLPNAFDVILAKGSPMQENKEISRAYYVEADSRRELRSVAVDITSFRGKSQEPRWLDVECASYSMLCTVHGDTTRVQKVKKKGARGEFFVLKYNVILICGLTELKAQISWIENGKEKRGPATFVYDDDAEAKY